MIAIAVGGAVLRIALVLTLPDGQLCLELDPSGKAVECVVGHKIDDGIGGDGAVYVDLARRIASGAGFTNPNNGRPYAMQAPLWPLVLAGTDQIGLEDIRAKQILAAVIGGATVATIGLLGRRVAGSRVGLVAAGIAAAYPGLWLYERNLNIETISSPLVAVVLLTCYRFRASPTWAQAGALGAATGLRVLARSELVLLVPFLVLPVVVGTRSIPMAARAIRFGLAAGLVVLLAVPWFTYNLGRFEHPVLLSNSFGFTAQAGTCDSTFEGDRLGGFDAWHCLVLSPGTAATDETVADRAYRDWVVTYTRNHLGRLPIVVLAREGRMWGLYAPGQHVDINSQILNAPASVLWVQTTLVWALLALAVVGGVLLRRRRAYLYPLLVLPAISAGLAAVTFGDPRYRASADVALIVLAAVAIDAALRRWRPATHADEPPAPT